MYTILMLHRPWHNAKKRPIQIQWKQKQIAFSYTVPVPPKHTYKIKGSPQPKHVHNDVIDHSDVGMPKNCIGCACKNCINTCYTTTFHRFPSRTTPKPNASFDAINGCESGATAKCECTSKRKQTQKFTYGECVQCMFDLFMWTYICIRTNQKKIGCRQNRVKSAG